MHSAMIAAMAKTARLGRSHKSFRGKLLSCLRLGAKNIQIQLSSLITTRRKTKAFKALTSQNGAGHVVG
jgi:hypothetical protein